MTITLLAMTWVFFCVFSCQRAIFSQLKLNWRESIETESVCGNAETNSKDRYNKVCVYVSVPDSALLSVSYSLHLKPPKVQRLWLTRTWIHSALSLCLFPSPTALQQRLQPAGEYISNAFLKLYLNTRCKLGVFWLTKPNIGFRTLNKCI